MEIPFADLRPMHDEIRADLDALYLVLKAYGIGCFLRRSNAGICGAGIVLYRRIGDEPNSCCVRGCIIASIV